MERPNFLCVCVCVCVCVSVCVCMYRIVTGDQWESVFLLAGDDLAVHLYRESLLSEVWPSFSLSLSSPPPSLSLSLSLLWSHQTNHLQLSFAEELSSDLFFPEFGELPSSVTSLDMRVVGTQRLTVFSCQSGYIRCSLVDITAGSKFAPDNSARAPSLCDAYPTTQRCCAAGLVISWMDL
jgi:hypothetical protein